MLCKKCNKEIPVDSNFCSECLVSSTESQMNSQVEKTKPSTKEGCIGCLAIIVSAFLIGSCFFGGSSEKSDTSTKQNSTVASEKTEAVINVNQQINNICNKVYGEDIVELEILNNVKIPEGKTVMLIVKGKDNLSSSFVQKSMLNKSSKLLKELYTSGLPIADTRIMTTFPLVDKYGNKSNGTVMRCGLQLETAQKINWANSETIDFQKILDEYWQHPSFSK